MKTLHGKIDSRIIGCLITPDVVYSINSLIDVVTEHEKRITTLEYLEDKRQSRKAGKEVGIAYSAQRSTGIKFKPIKGTKYDFKDEKYCTCENIFQTREFICGLCHKPYFDNPIKPQEEIREKIVNIVDKIYSAGWCDGDLHNNRRSKINQEYTDKILTIVRGKV